MKVPNSFDQNHQKKLLFFVQKAHKNILHDLFQDLDTFELTGGTLIHGCCAVSSFCMFF